MDKSRHSKERVKTPGLLNELNEELPTFLKNYRDSLIKFIDNFSLPLKLTMPNYLDILYQLRVIACFYDGLNRDCKTNL